LQFFLRHLFIVIRETKKALPRPEKTKTEKQAPL
jgi:hypothetical protein